MGKALAVATVPLWWGGYLLLVYPPSLVEYAAGAAVAVIASAGTLVVLTVGGRRWRRPPGVLRTVRGLPWKVLRGSLTVLAAALRPGRGPLCGGMRRERASGIGRDDPVAAGRRAWTGWARSLAADELVVGFPEDDTVLVHVLPSPRDEP